MKTTTTSSSRLDRSPVPSVLFGHAAAGAALVMIGYFLAILRHFEWILGAWSTPFVLMVVVAVMVMVLLTVRREEGELAFGRAFGLALLAGWLARLGYNLFNLVYFHLLHPEHVEAYVELVVDKSSEALGVFGLDAEALGGADMAGLFREQALWSLSPAGQGADALTAIVWLAIVALIVSAILKRPPESGPGLDA